MKFNEEISAPFKEQMPTEDEMIEIASSGGYFLWAFVVLKPRKRVDKIVRGG